MTSVVCTSRPGRPCAFCTQVRAEMKVNSRPRRERLTQDEESRLVEDFMREYEKGRGRSECSAWH